MRFDDSLNTILASDTASGFGAQATWRQLVDLVGRGRVGGDLLTIERLRALRPSVAPAVRAASARALAFGRPPATLVALFAEDELAIAAPVLRTATLAADEWVALLPALSPAGRSVLRHRRDLADAVARALESFGTVDFVLGDDSVPEVAEVAEVPPPPADDPAPSPTGPPHPTASLAAPALEAVPVAPLADTPFQPLADIARHIPLVAEALRRRDAPAAAAAVPDRFEIADLKARIDAFQRDRAPPAAPATAAPATLVAPEPDPVAAEPDSFRFETDARGFVRWVDGPARTALIGISLAHTAPQGLAQIDGVAAGAFRNRARFGDARLLVEGESAAAGAWRLSAVPAFDPSSGRFIGYRGVARRPRADEAAEPSTAGPGIAGRAASDTLRQLVHELRTPTNAIAGFAELIETQLLGPVAPPYRERAVAIRHRTDALLAAIDDLDTAARIAGQALDLRPATVPIEPLIARILADLAPLAQLRRAGIAFDPAGDHRVVADDRATERLIGRLLAALLSVTMPGERLRLKVKDKADGSVAVQIDRPAALAAVADDRLLRLDPDVTGGYAAAPDDGSGAGGEATPLLGTGFALRLARNLAAELGGSLTVASERLTLRLPAALDRGVEQAAR